jgi:hypothetical protein
VKDHSKRSYSSFFVTSGANYCSISYAGIVAAIAKFDDEVKELRAVAADIAFNLYREAGVGSADHVWNASS